MPRGGRVGVESSSRGRRLMIIVVNFYQNRGELSLVFTVRVGLVASGDLTVYQAEQSAAVCS